MKLTKEQELKILKTRAKESAEVLNLLYYIARELSFTRDVDVLIDKVVERIGQVMRTQDASLILANPETGLLTFTVIKGMNSQAMRELDAPLQPGEGLAGWVFVNNEPAVANDAHADPRFKPGMDWMTGYKTKNLLAVPVRTEGKTLGVLEVINRKKDDFTEDDAEFLTAIGYLLGAAVENAYAYKTLFLSKKYLDGVLEYASGGFIGVDARQCLVQINPRAADVLGLAPHAIRQRYGEALSAHAPLVQAIEAAFSQRQNTDRQIYEASVPGRGRRRIGYSVFPIPADAEKLHGVGVFFQDITDPAYSDSNGKHTVK